jgi:hypothetical protein
VKALNSVIREGKYLFLNDEITDMKEERRWFEHSAKSGMFYLVARVEGKASARFNRQLWQSPNENNA